MFDPSALYGLVRRRLSRRALFRAGGAGVATALIVGTERVMAPAPVEASSVLAAAEPSTKAAPPSRAELLALDPHAFTGRTYAPPAEQTGPRLKILPLDRAKLLAGARFYLRVEATGIYADAGFPNFVDSTGDGFPDDPDPTRTLFMGWNNHPDFHDDYAMDLKFAEPAMPPAGQTTGSVPNPARDADAERQIGNLPTSQPNCVHVVDDVWIVASGPGSEKANGVLDNTEVFFVITNALGIDARRSV